MFEGVVGEFPLTQWSLIDRAQAADSNTRQAALSMLLQRYIPALRAHLKANRLLSPDSIDDLLQGFIADKVVEKNLLLNQSRTVR